MAVIKKDGNYMGLPMNIARGNPIPLDKSEIWYSYDEMANYAINDAVAYVGQILGLVDETNNTATAYIILNTNGDLQEVGAAVVVDEHSIAFNDNGKLALKNWGVEYYAWIEATEDVEGHYELQQVDDTHPWIAGLEPRVTTVNDKLVLAWYQPNSETVDGLNASVSTLQNEVSALKTKTSGLETSITNINEALEDTYSKAETDTAIATAVANSSHLSYKIVDFYADIDPSATGADKYIYLVPRANGTYEEYMVINGAIEKVGDWSVDLSGYATTEDLAKKVDIKEGYRLVSETEILTWNEAERNFIRSVKEEELNVDADGKLSINAIGIDKVTGLQDALDNKVTAQEGYTLLSPEDQEKLAAIDTDADGNLEITADNISNLSQWISENASTQTGLSENNYTSTDATKLAGIEEGAQKNYITSVTDEFTVVDGHLDLVELDISKVTGLQEALDQKLESDDLTTLSTDITQLKTDVSANTTSIVTLNNTIGNISTSISDITKQLENYVDWTTYNKDIAELRDALTWQEMT